MKHYQYISEDDEIVPVDAGCPACGERRMEHLVNRDGIITCDCGQVYDLEPGREAADEQ